MLLELLGGILHSKQTWGVQSKVNKNIKNMKASQSFNYTSMHNSSE